MSDFSEAMNIARADFWLLLNQMQDALDAKDRLLDAYNLEAESSYDLLTRVSVPSDKMALWSSYVIAREDRQRMEDEK